MANSLFLSPFQRYRVFIPISYVPVCQAFSMRTFLIYLGASEAAIAVEVETEIPLVLAFNGEALLA
jgi:hypothetical protein